MKKSLISFVVASVFTFGAIAEDEYQDMSDPLAVYTQLGVGITDKGLNLKVGQTYDTGSATTMAMNIIEVKGIAGEILGFRDEDEALYQAVDNSVDFFRFRNFTVDMTNGRGSQVDVNVNVDKETMDASYSLIQALPKWKMIQLYPLAGIGLSVKNDAEEGYQLPGTYAVLGFYGKITVTDKIWMNYNPIWLTTMSGSDVYKETNYANENAIFTHEFAISYQISPRSNIRYFANWNEKVDFADGDHRIEYNYQL